MNKRVFTLKSFEHLLPPTVLILGNPAIGFTTASPIDSADKQSIAFIAEKHPKERELLRMANPAILICHKDALNEEHSDFEAALVIGVDKPKYIFAKIVTELFVLKQVAGMHPTTILSKQAIIGDNAYIGHHCSIGAATIGKNAVIHGNVHIYDNVVIGDNVIIHAGCIIGADGFGYLKEENEIINFPHIGGVLIGDNVEIGANTCIDRGALSNTEISDNVKIDNLVHIAHNVKIGRNSFIIANAMIGGSTIIGENTWIAPSSAIRDVITIGNDVMIGMGAVVTKSVDDNKTVTGNPAKSLEELKKINAAIKSIIVQ